MEPTVRDRIYTRLPLVPILGVPKVRPCEMFFNIIRFKVEEFLAPRPNSKLEHHPLSAIRNFFIIIMSVMKLGHC
jgi:hypothetical protein